MRKVNNHITHITHRRDYRITEKNKKFKVYIHITYIQTLYNIFFKVTDLKVNID